MCKLFGCCAGVERSIRLCSPRFQESNQSDQRAAFSSFSAVGKGAEFMVSIEQHSSSERKSLLQTEHRTVVNSREAIMLVAKGGKQQPLRQQQPLSEHLRVSALWQHDQFFFGDFLKERI